MPDDSHIIPRVAGMTVSIPKEEFDLLHLDFDEATLRRAMRLTGIHRVRVAPSGMTAADYCTDSAARLIDELGTKREEIDGIIFATPHPDYVYPGNSGIVQERLGIPKKCIALDINHSCTGFIYGIFVADLMIRTGSAKNVLVCCGDTATHHTNPKDRVLRMVQGDGGGAAFVTGGGTDEMAFSFCHDGGGLKYLYVPAGGERMPRQPGVTDTVITDATENARTLEEEYMDGTEVMRFVLNETPPLIDDVLRKKGWEKEGADVFAFHQANEFIVKSLTRVMKLDAEKVPIAVDGYGNIGGASLALALCKNAPTKSGAWEKAVLAGFGTGMSGAAMAADFSTTRFWDIGEV